MAKQITAATLAAFTRGRRAVDAYVHLSNQQNHPWSEESATERLVMAADPEVKRVVFARPHEDVLGADWLWWFVDASGECFGALVQAKKLAVGARSVSVDYRHPGGAESGKQIRDLIAASDLFEVPAVYALYTGRLDPARREALCPAADRGDPCQRCERSSVMMFPALAAYELLGDTPSEAGGVTMSKGVPLEDAVDPSITTPAIEDFFPFLVGDEFVKLCEEAQTGARDLAKSMYRMVKEARENILPKFAKGSVCLGEDAVFPVVPVGGDANGPGYPALFYAHILRGLRHRLPDYVQQTLDSGQPPAGFLPHLAGMVLVTLQ